MPVSSDGDTCVGHVSPGKSCSLAASLPFELVTLASGSLRRGGPLHNAPVAFGADMGTALRAEARLCAVDCLLRLSSRCELTVARYVACVVAARAPRLAGPSETARAARRCQEPGGALASDRAACAEGSHAFSATPSVRSVIQRVCVERVENLHRPWDGDEPDPRASACSGHAECPRLGAHGPRPCRWRSACSYSCRSFDRDSPLECAGPRSCRTR